MPVFYNPTYYYQMLSIQLKNASMRAKEIAKTGKLDAIALEAIFKNIPNYNKLPAYLNLLTQCYVKEGNLQQAQAACIACLASEPSNIKAAIQLIQISLRLGDVDLAKKYVLDHRNNSILSCSDLLTLCSSAQELKETELANYFAERAVSLAPNSVEVRITAARVKASQKLFEEARRNVNYVKEFAQNPRIYQYSGVLYMQQKEYSKARADFEQVISLDADEEELKTKAHAGLIRCMVEMGDYQSALLQLSTSGNNLPLLTQNQLFARTYLALGNIKRAFSSSKASVNLLSQRSDSLDGSKIQRAEEITRLASLGEQLDATEQSEEILKSYVSDVNKLLELLSTSSSSSEPD